MTLRQLFVQGRVPGFERRSIPGTCQLLIRIYIHTYIYYVHNNVHIYISHSIWYILYVTCLYVPPHLEPRCTGDAGEWRLPQVKISSWARNVFFCFKGRDELAALMGFENPMTNEPYRINLDMATFLRRRATTWMAWVDAGCEPALFQCQRGETFTAHHGDLDDLDQDFYPFCWLPISSTFQSFYSRPVGSKPTWYLRFWTLAHFDINLLKLE